MSPRSVTLLFLGAIALWATFHVALWSTVRFVGGSRGKHHFPSATTAPSKVVAVIRGQQQPSPAKRRKQERGDSALTTPTPTRAVMDTADDHHHHSYPQRIEVPEGEPYPTEEAYYDTPTLHFAIIGDWGGPGRQPQRDVATAMDRTVVSATTINGTPGKGSSSSETHLPRYDFVISTGDNMYEDGVASVHDKKFNRNFERVYTQPSLQCRWYMSLGNHDHGAHGVTRNVYAEVNYTWYAGSLTKRWYQPSPYYTQRIVFPSDDGRKQNVTLELFVLDSYDVSPRQTKMTDKQLHWFHKVLGDSTADWRLVVGHRPLFSAGAKHGSSPYMQHKLLSLMKEYNVTGYFSGDDHELQLLESHGIKFVVSGGGARAKKDLKKGGIKQTVFQYGGHGFVYAQLSARKLVLRFVDSNAKELYEDTTLKKVV